jgi:hypothetical protein
MHTSSDEYTWEGKSPNDKSQVFDVGVSPGYIATMKMKIKRGRDFDDTDAADTDTIRSVIINETLARKMGEQGKLAPIFYVSHQRLKWRLLASWRILFSMICMDLPAR